VNFQFFYEQEKMMGEKKNEVEKEYKELIMK